MYTEELPEILKTTTIVKIKYDCCLKEKTLKWKDADKNFNKNNGKHICHPCWLKSDDNPAKKPENLAKIKSTIDKKYGGVLPMNTQEAIEAKKQKLKNPEFVKERNEKRIATSIIKYGADHHMKTEFGKQLQKQAMIEKYGVEHPLQSPEIVAKMLQTVQERHGVENVMQIPEVMEKQQQSTLETHGVKHYNQLPVAKEYLKENCTKWLAQSYANPWAKGIVRPEEWNKKQSETMVRLLIEGKLTCSHKGSIRGYFLTEKCKVKKAFFRSHLELLVHYHFDNDEQVLAYQYEPFSIPFVDINGNHRLYVPDFLVFYKDKEIPIVVECKPEYMTNKGDNPLKFQFMAEHADKNDLIFEVWNEKRIHGFGNYKDIINSEKVVRI